jgi:allene oxide cyclase
VNPAAAEPQELTMTEHNSTQVISDAGASSDSPGDILTFANEVFDADDKNKIGSDNGVCL